MPRQGRTVWERIASAACLGMVLGSLIVIDTRVRDRFWITVDQGASYGLNGGVGTAGDYLAALGDVVRDQSIAEAPVLFFGVICLGLMVMLFRS